jgi:hypothetical protein
MKVGSEPEQDPIRVRAAREAIGSKAQLLVDTDGAYDRKQALARAQDFAEYDVIWLEEPILSVDLGNLRLLRDRLPAGMVVAAADRGHNLEDDRRHYRHPPDLPRPRRTDSLAWWWNEPVGRDGQLHRRHRPSKYLRQLVHIDQEQRLVTVQTGVINDQVNEALKPYDLLFPADSSTHAWCTIGGNIGNNSCGVHSVHSQFHGHGPRTPDNVQSLYILTYDGVRMTLKDCYSEDEITRIKKGSAIGSHITRLLINSSSCSVCPRINW